MDKLSNYLTVLDGVYLNKGDRTFYKIFTFSREMGLAPLPTYFRTVESIYSEVPLTSNLTRATQILRLEPIHMNYDIKQSGERIQQLRLQKGYTQEALASKLSIDRSLLSHIESGKRGCSVDLLVQLSNVFNVSLDILVLGKETALPDAKDRELLKSDIVKLID